MDNPHDAALEAAAEAIHEWHPDPETRRRVAETVVTVYETTLVTHDTTPLADLIRRSRQASR